MLPRRVLLAAPQMRTQVRLSHLLVAPQPRLLKLERLRRGADPFPPFSLRCKAAAPARGARVVVRLLWTLPLVASALRRRRRGQRAQRLQRPQNRRWTAPLRRAQRKYSAKRRLQRRARSRAHAACPSTTAEHASAGLAATRRAAAAAKMLTARASRVQERLRNPPAVRYCSASANGEPSSSWRTVAPASADASGTPSSRRQIASTKASVATGTVSGSAATRREKRGRRVDDDGLTPC